MTDKNSGHEEKKEEVLEGEVVGKEVDPKATKKQQQEIPKINFSFGAVPIIKRLKRNCLIGTVLFVALIAAAIYTKNWWFVPLAFVLPLWIFSALGRL